MYSKPKCPLVPAMLSFALILIYSSHTWANDTRLQSLSMVDDYLHQRPCAQGCFYGYPLPCDRVGNAIGCTGCDASENYCFCRPDLQPSAYFFIQSCVKTACTAGSITLDLQTATNLYSDYCSSVNNPSTAPALTSTNPSTTSSTVSVSPSPTTKPSTPIPTSTSQISTSDSYIISTVPPEATTEVSTEQATATVTKVFVSSSPTNSSSGGKLEALVVMLVVRTLCIASSDRH